MRSIINYFLRNSVAANLLMVFIFIVGLFGLSQLQTTFFPEQPTRIISIQLVYPGASPEELEEGVVTKIEENLVGLTGLKRTTSVSSENAASVTVEAEIDADIDLLLQDVKNAVDRISSFPRDLEPPVIFKQEQYSDAYIFSLSSKAGLKRLKEAARKVEDDLLAIDGISKIEIRGFPDEEIEISFREKDMRTMNITFDEAVQAISNSNLLTTGGTIKSKDEELLIRSKNKSYYANELNDIVLRSNQNGGLIRLDQIADIKDKWADNPSRSFVNGATSVILSVKTRISEDMFFASGQAQNYLADFELRNPDVTVTQIRDGKEYLNGRISFIKENGLLGFIIVLGLLTMFLNWRMAFWVALAIPISFAGMFAAASFLDVTINVISTFGMVVVIGILVDDGIVIAENIYQRYEKGESPMTAALEGTMEVLPAVTAAIITTVIAFSSFFFIDGFLGSVFKQLAIVVIFTLVFSLIEGAFILPAHIAHSKSLSQEKSNPIMQFFDNIMKFLKENTYGPVLRFAMKYSFPTVAICIAALVMVIGGFAGGIIKTSFFPFVQQDNFNVNVEMPAGTRETETIKVLDSIERASWVINDRLKNKYFNGEEDLIEKIEKNIGPTSYQGNIQVYLMKGEKRDSVPNRKITNMIKGHLGEIKEAEKLVFGLGNIFGDPVSISLLGSDSKQLIKAVNELKEEMRSIPALTDIQDSNKEGLKEVNIKLKPKAYSLGFTIGDIMRVIRQGFFGAEIQRLQRGADEVRVWVRYALEDRASRNDLSNMRIRTADGQSIPLHELAEFSVERGVISIQHIDGQREIRIRADVNDDKASTSDINADIQSLLIPKVLSKYPSVKVGVEGQARENAETMASMQKIMPFIFICMLFVIIITFSSVSQALIVFMLIPFGLIGVGLGHGIMGQPFSLLSALGVIALIGIIVNDALVFISSFNEKIKQGLEFEEALYQSGTSRFRPIVLTTITTVAGLMPLLLEKSVQAQFLIPMAISVAFGLLITTFILLVMIPALMTLATRLRKTSYFIWTGEWMTARNMEPANPDRVHPWGITLFLAILTLLVLVVAVFISFKLTGIFL